MKLCQLGNKLDLRHYAHCVTLFLASYCCCCCLDTTYNELHTVAQCDTHNMTKFYQNSDEGLVWTHTCFIKEIVFFISRYNPPLIKRKLKRNTCT
jgi:hypothetical protein